MVQIKIKTLLFIVIASSSFTACRVETPTQPIAQKPTEVISLAVAPNGLAAVSTGDGGRFIQQESAQISSLALNTQFTKVQLNTDPIGVSFNADHTELLFWGNEKIQILDSKNLRTLKMIDTQNLKIQGIKSAVFSSATKDSIALILGNGFYYLNSKSEKLSQNFLSSDEQMAETFAISPNGKYVAIRVKFKETQFFQVYDVSSQKIVGTIENVTGNGVFQWRGSEKLVFYRNSKETPNKGAFFEVTLEKFSEASSSKLLNWEGSPIRIAFNQLGQQMAVLNINKELWGVTFENKEAPSVEKLTVGPVDIFTWFADKLYYGTDGKITVKKTL